MVFTEFLDFAAQAYPEAGRPTVSAALGGELSPIASYPESGLRDLVSQVAESTGCGEAEVLRRFGTYLFHRFAAIYPVFFLGPRDSLIFLSKVHEQAHGDLRRFHPEAEVPELVCEWVAPRELVLEYRSPRSLADLAEGLILGCIDFFGDDVRLARQDLPGRPGEAVRFTLCEAQAAPRAFARAAS